MNAKQKRILRYVGYVAFYLFALLFFAFVTFPFDRLRTRIQNEFNASQTGPNPLSLRLGHLSSYWVSGVRADDVDLIAPPSPIPPEDPSKPNKPKVMRIDTLHARVSLLRLLFGTVHLNFGADAFGGEVSGFTSDADGGRKLEVDIEDLSLANAPLLADMLGLPIGGTLAGHVEFLLPEGKLSKAEGKVDLTFSGLSAGDGKTKVLNAIALPKVEVGDLILKATAVAGALKVDQLSAAGKDLDLQGDGSVRLRDDFNQSVMSMNARFKFNERFTNKDDMTRSLFGAPGSSVPALFDMVPQNKHAKRPDGFYGWRVNGTFAHPTFVPGNGAVAVPGGATL